MNTKVGGFQSTYSQSGILSYCVWSWLVLGYTSSPHIYIVHIYTYTSYLNVSPHIYIVPNIHATCPHILTPHTVA